MRVARSASVMVWSACVGTMLALSGGLGGCASTGIALRESFGIAKREQLVDRVTEARDSQNQAKVQFESALAEFMSVTGAPGGELESKYKKLDASAKRCQERADTVHARIASVELVSAKLFSEWESELKQYQSATLRSASERQLQDTKGRYQQLIGVMKQAESKMQPVLAALKDQVLFLKHNLNAQAIASLQSTASQIQSDVGALIRDMEASIAEANDFIAQMQPPK